MEDAIGDAIASTKIFFCYESQTKKITAAHLRQDGRELREFISWEEIFFCFRKQGQFCNCVAEKEINRLAFMQIKINNKIRFVLIHFCEFL